jgi:hypothetical protein
LPVRASLKIIACIYALLGTASALGWLYAVLLAGSDPAEGILAGPWLLGLAYGLVTFRPWARTLGLVTSGLLGVVGVLSLIRWWLVHVQGGLKNAQGLIVERPVAALFLIALLIAFPAWQWWVFSRPQVLHLYSSKSA